MWLKTPAHSREISGAAQDARDHNQSTGRAASVFGYRHKTTDKQVTTFR